MLRQPTSQEPDIIELVRAQEQAEEGGGPPPQFEGERDPLFREPRRPASRTGVDQRRCCSASSKIGYGRAARIIDQLLRSRHPGPPDGSKPRDILIGIDQLDEYAG